MNWLLTFSDGNDELTRPLPHPHHHRRIPSLHVDYKNTRIKQYRKEGRALRAEKDFRNSQLRRQS